jgi:phosphoglycolate phosphatase-like HAD superfamily hydrolase
VLGLWAALSAAELVGFGLAGLVLQCQAGLGGVARYGALALTAVVITGVFLSIAAWLASGHTGRRTRVLALALVVWFLAVVLFDVAALGVASLLRSGSASRLLIWATLVNPVDAARTGALLAIEGTSAFGAATAALRRFTGGMTAAGAAVACATSKRAEPAAWALRLTGLTDLVPVLVTMEDTPRHKPDPAPLALAVARCAGVAADAAYVGDAVVDLQAARAAGMVGVGVAWGAGERAELEAADPYAVAGSVGHLRSILLG